MNRSKLVNCIHWVSKCKMNRINLSVKEESIGGDTYLFLLHIEVVNDDTNEEVECEERSKHDEENKVEIHHHTDLTDGLVIHLHTIHTLIILRRIRVYRRVSAI